MSTDLGRISERARKEPGLVFTSLYHHVTDVDNLRACYDAMPRARAAGIDGISKAEYGQKLEGNLQSLSTRLKQMGYRPKPKRRSSFAKQRRGSPVTLTTMPSRITWPSAAAHVYLATRLTYKWLNRKSQRRTYNWSGFREALKWAKWPQPCIQKDLNPCRRAEAH